MIDTTFDFLDEMHITKLKNVNDLQISFDRKKVLQQSLDLMDVVSLQYYTLWLAYIKKIILQKVMNINFLIFLFRQTLVFGMEANFRLHIIQQKIKYMKERKADGLDMKIGPNARFILLVLIFAFLKLSERRKKVGSL